MANMLANYGLEFLKDDDKTYMGLVGFCVQEGKAVTGYYGSPYLFMPMGSVEFWVKTERKENGNLSVAGFDSHSGNSCVWDVAHSGIDVTTSEDSKLEKVIMFNKAGTCSGLLPIEVINADVLPGLMKGDKAKIQVVALPVDINYYANEDDYANAQPEDENGKKWMMAVGSMAAISFLYNHAPERYEKEKDYLTDRFVQFSAVVKKLYHGVFELNGEKHNAYIRCFADTEFGELEFAHTLEQVPEELRDNIRVGAIISGTCVLSGDVAINEYEKGFIKDFEHNLRLLRYTFERGDPERLNSVLATDAVYESDTSGKRCVGPREIIDRFHCVQDNHGIEYNTFYATITTTDEENLEYPVGTRCIVLADAEDDGYESIAFITVNEEGKITRIKISKDSRYHFEIDRPEIVENPLDDCKIPDSVLTPLVLRAKFNGIIDDDIEENTVVDTIPDYSILEQNAKKMLDALQKNPQPDAEKAFENIIGYLFAKAIERADNNRESRPGIGMHLAASYIPSEALAGKITSTLPSDKHDVLERAMKMGRQFYKDIRFFAQMNDTGEDDFVELFLQAAVIVQRLGQMYAEHCFDHGK